MSWKLVSAIEDNDAQRVRDTVAMLREGRPKFDLDRVMSNQITPLQHAIRLERNNAAMQLLDLGCSAKKLSAESAPKTLLYELLANGKGPVALAKKLIEHGVDVNKTMGEFSSTALGIAAKFNLVDIVQMIIEAGGYINHIDGFGKTALTRATETGSIESVSLLLRHGAAGELNALAERCKCDGKNEMAAVLCAEISKRAIDSVMVRESVRLRRERAWP